MSDIIRMKAELANLITQAEAIYAKAKTEKREPTDEEKKLFERVEKEINSLKTAIATEEKIEAWKMDKAKPVEDDQDADKSEQAKNFDPKDSTTKGLRFIRLMKAFTLAKGNATVAAEYARKTWGDPVITKALAAGVGADGGFLVPDTLASEIIDLLRPKNVVMESGARTIPMPDGNLGLPKLTSGASGTWIGENTDAPISQPAFGQVLLTAKTMVIIVPVSNKLLRFANQDAEKIVRDDVLESANQTMDLAFLRDQGLGAAPKGLRYWAPPQNVIVANATVTAENVEEDLSKIELAVEEADVALTTPGYIFAPRTKHYLLNARDTNGAKAFPEVANGTLRGAPYKTTTKVPTNIGGDDSEVIFADFAEALVGIVNNVRIEASAEASYDSGGGVMVSAFHRDQTLIKLTMEVDFAMKHEEAVAVLTEVKWEPGA